MKRTTRLLARGREAQVILIRRRVGVSQHTEKHPALACLACLALAPAVLAKNEHDGDEHHQKQNACELQTVKAAHEHRFHR